MCNRRFKYNVHESLSFIQWLNHSPLQLQSLRSFGFMLVHVMYGFFSPFCTFNFAHCSFYLPIHFLCMLLLNVPSTWWPLCVNSQMQLKVVCVFVLFFLLFYHAIWKLHGCKSLLYCRIYGTMDIVHCYNTRLYRWRYVYCPNTSR